MRKIVSVLISIVLFGFAAHGAGFSIFEQSADAMGQGMAVTARSDFPSGQFYNPAGISYLDGMSLSVGTTLIRPESEFTYIDGSEWNMEEKNNYPSNLYFNYEISDAFSAGVGIFSPYGLRTEWNEAGFPGRYLSRYAEVETIYFNPVGAYNFEDASGNQYSFALGINYVDASAEARKDINMQALADSIMVTGQSYPDTHSKMSAEGDAWTFNFGFLTKIQGTHNLGISYRGSAEVDFDEDGRAVFYGDSTKFDATFGGFGYTFDSLFPDQKASTSIEMPANASLGYAYTGLENIEMEFDLNWMEWSSYDELAFDFEKETIALKDSVTKKDWEDVFSYRFGLEYDLNERWDLRTGMYFDESPIPDETYSPMMPGGDRWSLQAGFGFHYKNFTVDFAYMPLWFDEVGISRKEAGAKSQTIPGDYEGFANLAGLSFSWQF